MTQQFRILLSDGWSVYREFDIDHTEVMDEIFNEFDKDSLSRVYLVQHGTNFERLIFEC